MKRKILLYLIPILLLLNLAPGVVASTASAAPSLPHYFYGSVTYFGNDAPPGTTIEARGTGVVNGSFNPITITTTATYGSADPLADVPRLLVQGDIQEGTEITFYVNGVLADQTYSFASGNVTLLNLTTDSSTPAPPVLLTPSNGATINGASVNLTWQASDNASNYAVHVNTASDYTGTWIFADTVGDVTQYEITLPDNGTYYWRVFAYNQNGWSAPSTTRNLIAQGIASTLPPDAPVQLTPADGATINSGSVNLTWQASTGATSYALHVNTASDYSGTWILADVIGDVTDYVVTVPSDGTYYWRVFASNANGWSVPSATRSFITQGVVAALPPTTPTQLTPTDGATINGGTVNLTWQASTGATSYALHVNTASNYLGTWVFADVVGNVTDHVVTIPSDGTYYWRVFASNANGWSGPSATRSFTTQGIVAALPPAAPTQLTPADGATINGASANLTWQASSGASNYALHVNTASDFTGTWVLADIVGNVTDYIVTIPSDGTYYWRVFANNANGWSGPSTTRSFITQGIVAALPPVAPTQLTPADGATINGGSVNLTWQASSGATSYALQVNTASDYTGTWVLSEILGDVTNYVVTIPSDGTYYWRVFAYNANGWSGPSATRNFVAQGVVASLPPEAPVQLTPADGATASGTSLNFTWQASTGATSYAIHVNTSSDFTGTWIIAEIIGNVTQYTVNGFPNDGTTYYWRVFANNANGWSGPSATRSFINSP